MEDLRRVFGHSITVLEHDYGPWNRGEPEPSCYALAFGLASHPRYLQLVAARLGGMQPITSEFVTRLLQARMLRRRRAAVRVGDIVLYFAGDRVQHGGVVIAVGGRIRSKWGQAEVHEHALWQVPLSYGDVANMYLAQDPKSILALLEGT